MITSLDAYQSAADAFANHDLPAREELCVWALGCAGEAGEVADLVKKYVGHGHQLDQMKLMKELGDVLWYVAVLAKHLGFTLSDVASANIEKLGVRYPDRKFSVERSINRQPEESVLPVVLPGK